MDNDSKDMEINNPVDDEISEPDTEAEYFHPFTDETDEEESETEEESQADKADPGSEEFSEETDDSGSTSEPPVKKRRRRRDRRGLIILIVILVIAALGIWWYMTHIRAANVSDVTVDVPTAAAVRMDITSELTGSSSLSPKDTYDITSLVEGEILECTFEQGDVVEEGDVLYVIDSSSMNSSLSSAQTSLVRAQENLVTANENYNEAAATVSGNTYRSTATGYIQTLYIREGDKVSNGTKIAEIYDDSIMRLTVPFLTPEAEMIPVGVIADITLEDTAEELQGVVTSVSSYETTLSGGRLVKNVTIEVENPGGLTDTTMATAKVGEIVCASEGVFVAKSEFTLSAELSGNSSLEVEQLLVTEGSYVTNGSGIFTATAKSVSDYLKTFTDSLNTASDNVENAENQLENTEDSISDYTITAPISGTIVTKNSKAGDKISKNTSSSTVMAVIYDLSSMTLEISVDELDVRDVEVGQTVQVTADAIEGEVFYGTVTNVSLQGSYSNGVTNYPVTVTLEETGELRPGMNVDAVIVLEASENAICIPVGALQRGDRVFVKDSDDTTDETSEETEEAVSENGRPGAGNFEGMPEDMDIEEIMALRESAGGERPEGMPDGGFPERDFSGEGFPEGEMPVRGISEEEISEEEVSEESESGERSFSNGDFGERARSAQRERQSVSSAIDAEALLENINNTDQTGVPEGFHAVTVTTGIISDEYVEVLSGINEGDIVYVDPNAATTTTTYWNMGGNMGGRNMGGGNMGGGPGGGRP